jgi:hypothetical protein
VALRTLPPDRLLGVHQCGRQDASHHDHRAGQHRQCLTLLFGGKANGLHSYPGDMDEVALRIG